MNEEDKTMMDTLMQDKGKYLRIVVGDYCVWVEDKRIIEADGESDYDFHDYGWRFIIDLMKYLGLDCEES